MFDLGLPNNEMEHEKTKIKPVFVKQIKRKKKLKRFVEKLSLTLNNRLIK